MSTQKIDLLTPVGRLVSGDVFTGNTTDQQGRPLLIKSGPNAGQPKTEYYFGVAIPKTDPTYQTEIWAKLYEAAKSGFPTLFDGSGNCTRPDFAWKVIDGDSNIPNQNNTVPATKAGYPGHWVLSFKSGFAPKVYTKGGEALIQDPSAVKKGYYVRVYGTVEGNKDMQKPGVYLNPMMVELVGYGEEIISGPDGGAIFGGTPVAQLPAGASATPLAGTPMAMLGQMGGGAPAQTGGMPAPGGAPAQTGGMPAPGGIQPAHDFLNPQNQMGAAPAPGQTGAPKMYTVQGAQYTAEQLAEAGWTPQQIAALG